jgi:hypothetical protein
MNSMRFTVSITVGIAVVLLLIGGTGTSIILFTGYAQSVTLDEPIFVEKGSDVIKKEIGPNTAQYTFTSNGTLNGNVEYNKKGDFVSVSKGNNVTFDQGHGVITTKDGSETANYTFIEVGNGTDYQGASAYSTNSTGKLAFLNNIVLIFKGGYDENGNYALKQWIWK